MITKREIQSVVKLSDRHILWAERKRKRQQHVLQQQQLLCCCCCWYSCNLNNTWRAHSKEFEHGTQSSSLFLSLCLFFWSQKQEQWTEINAQKQIEEAYWQSENGSNKRSRSKKRRKTEMRNWTVTRILQGLSKDKSFKDAHTHRWLGSSCQNCISTVTCCLPLSLSFWPIFVHLAIEVANNYLLSNCICKIHTSRTAC